MGQQTLQWTEGPQSSGGSRARHFQVQTDESCSLGLPTWPDIRVVAVGSKELEVHLCSCGGGLTHGRGTDSELPAQSSLLEDTHHLGHADCEGPRWGEPEATRSFLYDLSITAQTRRKGPRNPQIQEFTSMSFSYLIVNFSF